jgi:hypothetical protein
MRRDPVEIQVVPEAVSRHEVLFLLDDA